MCECTFCICVLCMCVCVCVCVVHIIVGVLCVYCVQTVNSAMKTVVDRVLSTVQLVHVIVSVCV